VLDEMRAAFEGEAPEDIERETDRISAEIREEPHWGDSSTSSE